MNATKIICTLGPATKTEEDILRLVEGGMNIARINMSHGTWEQHQQTIKLLKRVNETLAKRKTMPTSVAILLDTQGAEVRTGIVEKPLTITRGEEVVFAGQLQPQEKRQVIIVNYEHFGKDVRDAERILLDNGTLDFELVDVRKDGSVIAKAVEDGVVGSRRHVNLPGANLTMPSITDKDWEDLAHGAEEGVDYFALSFVREAKEVEEVRAFLAKKGAHPGLIAKVETRQAVTNMEAIIAVSDAVMVARGDLGAEVAFERIPVIQDQLVSLCRKAGKPVIVATHMLESMIDKPMPTRAEVTDIAHAVMTGADATMLSGETASGKYPFQSLDAMRRVIKFTEAHLTTLRRMEESPTSTEREARARAAVALAVENADVLLVMTRQGQTARDVARFRPCIPLIACAPDQAVQRALQLCYSAQTIHVPFDDKDPEKGVMEAFKVAKSLGLLKTGQRCVLVSDAKVHDLTVSTVQTRSVP